MPGRLATIVTTTSIVLAFPVAVAIGLVFGLYPAARAAGPAPVEALHYDSRPGAGARVARTPA